MVRKLNYNVTLSLQPWLRVVESVFLNGASIVFYVMMRSEGLLTLTIEGKLSRILHKTDAQKNAHVCVG